MPLANLRGFLLRLHLKRKHSRKQRSVSSVGRAKCNSPDNFCKRLGRELSLRRAFDEISAIVDRILTRTVEKALKN